MKAFKGINREVYMEMIGSLPQLRKMAQSLQTSIDSMVPLAEPVPRSELKNMAQWAREIDAGLAAIYHDEAPEAFGESR